MRLRFRALLFVLSVAGLIAVGFGGTLSTKQLATLHPAFQALVARSHPEFGLPGGAVRGISRAPGAEGRQMYDAIITTKDAGVLRMAGITVRSVYPSFVTASVSADDLVTISALETVSFIDPGSENYPLNDVSVPETGAPLVHDGYFSGVHYDGQGAIVVIYDSGIDWKHLDFRSPLDTTKSRILAIWDQTLNPGPGESSPVGLGYGVEYTQANINAELGASPPGFVRESDVVGHGTHVAGIAAGNGLALGRHAGMAPKADIVIIKGGNSSFSESRMIDGLTYASAKATQFGEPVALNWSIGGQAGPHDGSRAYEEAVDNFVSTPGRVVAVSAGNDGASNIHISGSAGATTNITFSVPTYTPVSGTGNDAFGFDLWFEGAPTVTSTVTSPNGSTASAGLGQTGAGNNISDGSIYVYNYPSYTSDGSVYVEVYVSDDGGTPPATGTWTLTITNTGNTTAYDGWLWRAGIGNSVVTLNGGNAVRTIAMPGTSMGAITAGSYVTRWSWPSYNGGQYVYTGTDRTSNISSYSSMGPTRDGRQKPDIAAPGQGIASSLSSTADTAGQSVWVLPGQKHWIEQGTSMSAPHVAGAAALILGAYPTTTSAQVKSLITGSANSDSYTGAVPNYVWGYGKLDIAEAFARKGSPVAIVTRNQIAYDGTGSNATTWITGSAKVAVRFSPGVSGGLTGATIMPTTVNNRPIRGTGNAQVEVYSDNSGVPGTKLGSTVSVPLALFSPGEPAYVSLLDAGVNASVGTDFHVVVSVPGAGDSLLLRTESVSSGTHSSSFNGSTWSTVTTNHRIRAIVTTSSGVNAVDGEQSVPLAWELGQNYPNPFNPTTQIAYTVAEKGMVTIRVYDLLGRVVSTLVDKEEETGSYRVTWNGKDARNLPVTSGVYFYRIESRNFAKTMKMVMLK